MNEKTIFYTSICISTGTITFLTGYALYKAIRKQIFDSDHSIINSYFKGKKKKNYITKYDSNQPHRQNKPHRFHKVAHGPPLPLTEAPDGPYSEEAHQIYSVCLKIGQDALRSAANAHYEVMCTYCRRTGMQIHGVRYICAQCGEIELCEQCERENVHEPSHLLYKLPYYIPTQLVNLSIHRNQIPWQTDDNLNFLSSHYVPSTLSFGQIEELKSANNDELSSAEIEALYDQFCCIADISYEDYHRATPLQNDDEFSNPDASPAVTKSALSQVLATRYSTDTYLRNFLCDLYDDDNDGIISFGDYVYGVNLITSTEKNKKCRQKVEAIINACPNDMEMKTHLRNLILAFIDLTKNAFADALNIQAFGDYPEEEVHGKNSKIFKDENNDHHHKPDQDFVEFEQDNLLWERRQEINTWANYDPVKKTNSQIDSEVNILWDLSIEDVLNELFDQLFSSHHSSAQNIALVDIILSDSKYLNTITACLEAGII